MSISVLLSAKVLLCIASLFQFYLISFYCLTGQWEQHYFYECLLIMNQQYSSSSQFQCTLEVKWLQWLKIRFLEKLIIFFPFMQAGNALTRSQWIHPDINILQLLYHRILQSHICTSADNLSQSSRLDTSPHSTAQ